jgi:hypothetical protein
MESGLLANLMEDGNAMNLSERDSDMSRNPGWHLTRAQMDAAKKQRMGCSRRLNLHSFWLARWSASLCGENHPTLSQTDFWMRQNYESLASIIFTGIGASPTWPMQGPISVATSSCLLGNLGCITQK